MKNTYQWNEYTWVIDTESNTLEVSRNGWQALAVIEKAPQNCFFAIRGTRKTTAYGKPYAASVKIMARAGETYGEALDRFARTSIMKGAWLSYMWEVADEILKRSR